MIEQFKTTFEEYVDPSQSEPEATAVHVPVNHVDPSAVPEGPAVPLTSRRMRLGPADFERYGYTGGCQRSFICEGGRQLGEITAKFAEEGSRQKS